jgi:beta-lactamase class A
VLRLFDAGASFTLHDAPRIMIVVSDNTATDLCLETAGGVDGVNACLSELEIDGVRVTGTALDWFRALD